MRRLLPRQASAVAGIAAIALGGAAGVLEAGPAQASTIRASTVQASMVQASTVAPAQVASAVVRPAPDGYAPAGPSVTAMKSAERRADRLPRVVLPDLFAVASRGITAAELARLARLHDVRGVLAVDGGGVRIQGHQVSAIGVSPAAFRSWTPAQTAAQQGVWTALGQGELVTTAPAAKTLGLRAGHGYRVYGASQPVVRFGRTAALGIPGVDAVVTTQTSRQLGLVPQIGVLISAPKADLTKLDAQVRGVIGRQSRFVSLRPARQFAVHQAQTQLQAPSHLTAGLPTNYLQLFQDSAAKYCPGLPWTVLAAIGQIESGDGQNNGPSSAGALGPMQFMPSTWARWGIDAFGQTGPPQINNPFDAVPSAALYLCASGGGQGGAALDAAIFSYNHAAWYVAEVLALAHEYAQQYG